MHEVNLDGVSGWQAFKIGAAFTLGCAVVSVLLVGAAAGVAYATGVELAPPAPPALS